MRARLIFDSFTLTSAELSGGVTYNQTVNVGEDLSPGCASMAELSFSVLGENAITEGQSFAFEYTHGGEDSSYTIGGLFTVAEVKRVRSKTTVRAYDNMRRLDKDVSNWISGLTYPITLYNMLMSLCAYCGVTLGSVSITNGSFLAQRNIDASSITGRQVIAWIAEISASYAQIGKDGSLYLDKYTDRGTVFNGSKYIKYTKACYRTDKIDKVQLQSNDNDIGVITGTGENALIITGNPLVYAESDSEIRPAAEAIYSAFSNVDYITFEMTLLDDFGADAGDIITVNGEKTLVMTKKMSASGVVLSATGNKRREAQQPQANSEITRLRGRTNELTRTIDETLSRLTSAEGGVSEIRQTVESIDLGVTSIAENGQTKNTISLSGDGIVTKSITVNGTTAAQSATIVANAISGITLTSSNGEKSSTLTLKNGLTTLSSATIQFTGQVVFKSDLSTSGSTTINGDNITTGNISVDRISKNAYSYVVMPNTYYNGIIAMGNTQASPSTQMYVDGNNALITKNAFAPITFYPYGVGAGNITTASNYMKMYVQGYRVLTTLDAVLQ